MIRNLIEYGSPLDIVLAIIAFGLIVATILSLVYIIIGGITFILSAGNEEKIKKAVHTVRYAIIGLFVSFIAFFVVSWIAKLLDVPFDVSFSSIVNQIIDLFNSMR